jgi:hypothetical protein
MKKVLLPMLAFAALTMTSCKKDYTCVCKIGTESYNIELKDVKKSDAKDACKTAGNIYILSGGTCDLK